MPRLHHELIFLYDQYRNGMLSMIFMQRSYVVYPPEGPRPPSLEELREMAPEIRQKSNSQWIFHSANLEQEEKSCAVDKSLHYRS